jgi:hypothetical protein
METTVEGLRSFYKNNAENMERMKEENPTLHKELVDKFKQQSEKLSTPTE